MRWGLANTEKDEAANRGGLQYSRAAHSGLLFDARRNAGEGRVQARAERAHDRDDRNRNAGRYQAVFDGGRPGFIGQEVFEHVHDASLLLSHLVQLSEREGLISAWPPIRVVFRKA